ncbi:MAG: hypothetical protein NXH78_10845 [Hyphomonadaceae bacterium]|nr:hypothetical protein [Hyphomonadaceae bacterium]
MPQIQFLETDAAFALHVKQLQDCLYNQMEMALSDYGLEIPSKTTGIVQLLFSNGPCSKADIAKALRYSHQLTAQRLAWLIDHDMVEMSLDANDKRRRLATLSPSGIVQAEKLQEFLPRLAAAYRHLFTELDINLKAQITRARDALETTPITNRMDLSESQPQNAPTRS